MRCDATRRALLSRLFHLGRDSLSKLRKSITIFLARVSYHTIYGAFWLQRTYTPIPSSASLSLSLFHSPLQCFTRWTRNIILVHTRMVSRDAFRSRVARECLVVPKIADDELAHRHAPLSSHRFRYIIPSSSRKTRQKLPTYYFERRLSGNAQIRAGTRRAKITMIGTKGGMNEQRRGEKWSRTLRNEIHPRR